jgi:type IV pilus assembly protein PilQ
MKTYFYALVLVVLLLYPAAGQSTEEYLKQGYQQYIAGQFEDSLGSYDQALSLSPDLAQAYLWKGKCYLKLGDRPNALLNLKQALRLNPNNWGAKYLLAQLTQNLPENLPSPGNLSLVFQDTDVSQAIFMLAQETGLNLIPSRNLRGQITLSLNNISTSEALKVILEEAHARIVPEGSLLKVVPVIEQFEATEVETNVLVKTYKIDYVDTANLVATLTNMLPDAEKIDTVKGTNLLVVRGQRATVKKADALIKSMDVAPKQIVVEAKVVELRTKDNAHVGFDIKGTNPNDVNDIVQTLGLAGRPTDTGAQGIYAQVLSGNVNAYFSALANLTGTNIVASPRITTLNDKPAHILIGAKYGYKTAVITETTTTQQIEFLEVGTSLTITPHITRDGFIQMTVEPKVSDGSVVNDLPQENTTETKNEVMVQDGQTIVIGGLYKDKEVQTDTGVPFLMNIPFLGSFFRKTATEIEKHELLIFVTPHILTPETLIKMSKEVNEMGQKFDEDRSRLVH